MKFSDRINIPQSMTMAVNGIALKKKAAGAKVYNLSAGEPMVDTHPAVIDAARCAMEMGKTHYQPVAGIKELRFEATHFMNRFYGSDYTVEQAIVTNGGKFALYGLCQILLNPGDEVIIPVPYWVSYTSMVKLAGGVPVIVETKEVNSWKMSVEKLEEMITDRTKFLILNNASNPTGVFYTKEEIESILKLAKEKGIMVVSDEVYSGLVYDGNEYASCATNLEYRENTIIVQSCSKHFAMTGWRAGFVFADEQIINKLKTLQGQSTSGTSSITQWAAVSAFEHAEEIMESVRIRMQKRRDVFVDAINKAFDAKFPKPLSALYCFLPISIFGVEDTDSVKFCERVLNEANVAMVPGAAFGVEGYVRCSFGLPENELVEAVEKLKEYFGKYA